MNTTGSTAERLAMYAEILALIDAKRQATGASLLGSSVEQFILRSQCEEIETDILADPGAFEALLVRRRPAVR